MNVKLLSCVAGLLLVRPIVAGDKTASAPDTATDFLPALTEGQHWQLVWHDEFNGAQIDPNKWQVMGDSRRRNDWWLKDDAYLDGRGHLVIRTRQEGDRRSSGAVRTRGRFEHAFGYWVARLQLQKQPGHWTAFWLMSDRVVQEGNDGRDGTEIDICEFPRLDGTFEINLHWDGYGRAHRSAGRKITAPEITNGFNTFALCWTPTNYTFYVNGREAWRTTAGGVCQEPVYLKFSAEIGKWAGNLNPAVLPDHFLVDYVRVYDAVPATNRTAQPSP